MTDWGFHEQLETQRSIDATKLIQTAARRAVSDKMTTYIKKLIDNDMYESIDLGFGEDNDNRIMDVMKQLKEKTDNILDVKNGNSHYCFFTINYMESLKADEVYNSFKEFVAKSVYIRDLNYIWTMEQRSEVSGEEHGFHIHIVFEKSDNAPSKIQRAFKTRFFDKYVGTPQSLDYKYLKCPRNKIKYCLGIKDEEKMPKIRVDRKYKVAQGYPIYCSNGEEFQKIINEEKMADSFYTELPALPFLSETNILKDKLKSGI